MIPGSRCWTTPSSCHLENELAISDAASIPFFQFLQDLLMPAPPAPPVPEPALPAPVPTPEPSAQAGNGRPKAGSKDSSLGTCEQQGQQGSCK